MALLPNRNSASATDRKAKARAAEDDALLREVDDAVRSDQYLNIWQKYGLYIIGAIVLALLVFAAVLFFNHRGEGAMEADSEVLVTALDKVEAGNLKAADTDLAPLATDGEGGAQAQALMLRAGIALEQDRPKDAVAMFEQVAAMDDIPDSLSELAELRAIMAGYNTIKSEEAIRRLTPLAQEGKPYFGSAGEVLAMAYLDAGDKKKAGALFEKIAKDEDVADTTRGRARQMASVLGIDAVGDPDQLVEELRGAGGRRPAGPQGQ